MDTDAADRVIALFDGRGQLDRLGGVDAKAAQMCLDRARQRLVAASVLVESELWESAFTTAYDAFRTAADAVVLFLGYRVPATAGGHRIATDIAHAALAGRTDAFAPASAERFQRGRHESAVLRPCTSGRQDTWRRKVGGRAGRARDRSRGRRVVRRPTVVHPPAPPGASVAW